MKQKDIALIIIIAFVSGIVSFLISGAVFAPAKDRKQNVEVVEAMTSEFPEPSKNYFNSSSVDPTQLIQIGAGTNPSPFNGTSQ